MLEESKLSDNEAEGVMIAGSGCPVSIWSVHAVHNRVAGIRLHDAGDALIASSVIEYTRPGSDGRFGDGVFTTGTVVTFDENVVRHNARAGTALFGCDAAAELSVHESTYFCNGFDLELERKLPSGACATGTPGPTLIDDGGNRCFSCERTESSCHAVSTEIAPIPPPV